MGISIMDALKKVTTDISSWTNDKLDSKVDKVGGKSLSTNDYTTVDKNKVNEMATGLQVLNDKLYLTNSDGIIESTATTLPSGSGGGGSSASITLVNLLNSNEITVAYGGSANLVFEYASSESDSAATAFIYVSDILKKSYSINPGENTLDIGGLINEGVNNIKLTVSDIYSNSKSLSFVINAVSLKVTSTFDDSQIYDGDITVRYTPIGAVSKDVHFVIDNQDTVIATTSETNKQQSYIIDGDSLFHGAHSFIIYLSTEIDGVKITSNKLHYSIIAVDEGITTPIISSVCMNDTITQGEQMQIDYICYDPTNMSTDVSLVVMQNNEIYSRTVRTVNATKQHWISRDLPVGEVVLQLSYGVIEKSHIITVTESDIDIAIKTTDLEFNLSADGKSNEDEDRDIWENNGVTTTFKHLNYESTGWVNDDNNDTALRLSGSAKATINYKPFETDARSTGRTLEMAFKIQDVSNRDNVVISCVNAGKVGFTVTAETARFSSEQTEVSCNYTDEEKVYVTFVVEPRNELRLLRVYLNGILSGAKQYVENDNFQQGTDAKYIEIGSPYCSIDLYSIRSYNTALTDEEVRDNYIASITDINKKLALYEDNNIYDIYGNLSFDALKDKIPTLVIKGSSLPSYKGDKKKVSVSFMHPEKPILNYDDTATIDIQGTSSQFYIRKNWKIKTGQYHMIDTDKIETNVICMKADYAESTGSHNTSGAIYVHTLYGDAKVPPQETDARVRTSIWGFPCAIFFDSGDGKLEFIGRYNYNYEKSSEETYGFTSDWPDAFSVEFCNNTSDACLFRGEIPDNWGDDFEYRYPDGYKNIEDSGFKEMHSWVVSTCQDFATGEALADVYIGIDGTSYELDTPEYRLAKFKKEFTEHFDMDFALVYYVWGLFGLYVDSFAKNLFLTTFDRQHFYCYWYDLDTSWGIGNTGVLTFGPFVEDIDMAGDATVFNGQNSTLWKNFRQAFASEIKEFYAELRSDGRLTYDKIIDCFVTSRQEKVSISMFNEDADYKYISMLRSDNDATNLYQIRGDGAEHKKWFVKNREDYMDSKYFAGDYPDDIVSLRIYTPNRDDLAVEPCADITVTPYIDLYVGVKYKANGTLQQIRTTANTPTLFEAPNETFNDTETAIYGASNISSLGDLSPLYCGSVNVSKADKLVELIVGNGTEGYVNYNLGTNDGVLAVGANRLLQKIDVRNCPNLTAALALSQCPNIQEVYAQGTSITGLELPASGYLKKCYLPGTLTNLTITNQQYIEEFTLEGYDALTTLHVENAINIPVEDIMLNAPKLNRIRLIDIEWNAESEDALVQTINKFKACLGLDANGNNTDKAIVTGRVYVSEKVSDAVIGSIYNDFPDIIVDDGSDELYIVNYKDWDGSVLYSERLAEGEDAIDPIKMGKIEPPYRESDEYYSYEFIGWNMIPTNVSRHYIVTAQYNTKVAINFAVDGEIIHSDYVNYGTHAEDPVANGTISAPIKEGTDDLHYAFSGWDGSLLNVTMPRTVNAVFSNVHPVRFYATPTSSTPHHVQWIVEGQDAHDPSLDEGYTIPSDIMVSADEKQVFSIWNTLPTNVTGICEVHATYDSYWAVRFYNESTVVDLQWIKTGNSAVNPITRAENPIETPTKTSTAQYDFTFSKWEGDYTSVTEPTNIYAKYNSIIRKYTVEFYNLEDGKEILLWTQESVSYGFNATDPTTNGSIATPVKLGVEDSSKYEFTGWAPSYKNIQGYTKCYALFRYNAYLEDDWATIAANVENGTATDLYPIGGRKAFTVTLSDGVEYSIDVEIIAHNHDNLADGSGKAALTFLCKDLPYIKHKMYKNHTNSDGWPKSDMRSFVNGELFEALPEELKNVIKPVYKISDGGANSKTLITTIDSCWIPSYDEVGFAMNRTDNLKGQGEHYSSTFGYGSEGNSTRIKYLPDGYTIGKWWLRTSSYGDGSTLFFRVQNSGAVMVDGLWNEYYVALGFCI